MDKIDNLKVRLESLVLEKFSFKKTIFVFLLFISILLLNVSMISPNLFDNVSSNSEELLNTIQLVTILYLIVYSFYSSLQKVDIIRIGLSYFVYFLISYFLFLTRNLNNPDFLVKDWQENYLIQLHTLYIVLIIVSPIILRIARPNRRRTVNSEWLINGVVATIIVNDQQFIEIFKEMIIFRDRLEISYLIQEVGFFKNLIVCLFLFGTISHVVSKSLFHLRQRKIDLPVIVSSSLLFALIFNYYLQAGVKYEGELLGRFIFPGATSYQIMVLFFFSLICYILINRFLLASIFLTLVSVMISIANTIKFQMRGEPLLVTDFTWLKETKLVLSFIDQEIVKWIIIGTIGIVLLQFLLRKTFLNQSIIRNKYIRLLIFLVCCSFFWSIYTIFSNKIDNKVQEGIPIVSKLSNWYDIDWFGSATNARYRSLMYVWTKQLTTEVMIEPENYSKDMIDSIYTKYKNRADIINQNRNSNIADQTIIFILSESFADPSRLEGISLSQDVIPNIRQIKASTTSGLMSSEFYGGGTANLELQTLTGLPYTNYSPLVSIISTEVLPKMKYIPTLSDWFDGGSRYILHPQEATNYNRYQIYTSLGFEHLVFMSGSQETFSNPVAEGVSVSDQTVYNNIIERLDTTKSQFFSAITMQNHAPWIKDSPEFIKGMGNDFTSTEVDNLTSYARLLYFTDMATIEFLNTLQHIDKQITVVFYGDHLPGFYPSNVFINHPESQYQTDYFIWSNYETEPLSYPQVKASDFNALLFEHTNSKVSPYYALLTDVLHTHVTLSEEEKSAIEMYLKLIQYDISVGKGYIKQYDDFFDLLI